MQFLQRYFYISLKGALAIALIISIYRFSQKQTDGFTLLGISSNRPYNPKWETRGLTNEEQQDLIKALSQPYTYLSCGGQSFVFSSRDGDFVIKFFKQRLFQPPRILNSIPLPKILHRYREKRNWKRQDKLDRDFTSYKIAFEELQEETGILFVHLNATNQQLKKLLIKDKIGISHEIDLDRTDFIIQKKGQLVYERLHMLMQSGQKQQAEESIFKVLRLIVSRCKKGYHDRDPNVRTNCGFIGEKAIKIDVGRLMKQDSCREPDVYRQELLRIALPFQKWIEATYPELSSSFEESLRQALTL